VYVPRHLLGILALSVTALALAPPPAVEAQGVKLAVGDVGIGLGDVPRLDGLRFNFRDAALERVRGLNATVWSPREEAMGQVTGLALGVPLTGGAQVRGLGLGIGLGADDVFQGVGLGAVGVGAGESDPTVLHGEQTVHGSIQVTEREWEGGLVREMWQNAGSSSAEYVDTGDPAHRYATASQLLLEPVIRRMDRALVLGGAALSLPVALSRRRPAMEIDVVEIDPRVTELAREYFAYGRADYPDIRVTHEDARVFLRRAEKKS